MTHPGQVGLEILQLDAAAEIARIAAAIESAVLGTLRKKGVVVGISGGIDSAVVTALCARALGPGRVHGLFTPERHSSQDTLRLSRAVAAAAGVHAELFDITDALAAVGCYRRQDEAFRSAIPDYGEGWRAKIVLPSVLDGGYRVFSAVAISPDGREVRRRMSVESYLGLVAATNYKQRTRKMVEYYHAERLNYAVAGTPNRLEYDQGFFVKGGDGQADFKPIAHLYKSQVYQLAAALGIPDEVCRRPPTTDTYSMEQGQDEFYFSLPYEKMDLCLCAKNRGIPASALTQALGLSTEKIELVFKDIDGKRRTTRYQHLAPILVEDVPEISNHT
ncbi:MAG: NAD(+) synthase [Gemmatimonadaceae bacterium]|nr:NAD(+) synthase [Gemmatimonadaceae bacterium]